MYSKKQIFIFYILLTLVLTVIGYFQGKKTLQQNEYALYGLLSGIIISVILWYAWGKANSY